MRHRHTCIGLALLALGCASTATDGAAPAPAGSARSAPAATAPGDPLYPSAEGVWQIYHLYPEWIEANLSEPRPALVYVALVAAHPEDLMNDLGMCPAPQRIVLGRVAPDESVQERTFACLHVCGPGEADGTLYRGLWASGTYLEGTTARVLEDGSVTVFEHYRETRFMTPEVAEDPTIADKLRFEGDARVLQRSIAPSDFEFPEGEARSCVALEEGL